MCGELIQQQGNDKCMNRILIILYSGNKKQGRQKPSLTT